ncbi:HXXEE domain-containing protein [Riemerella anatipestifer]|uniref:Integral inner membrane protein n=2 Tax=Riemerella anatipestifer TaxID=34085 RepID=E4TDX0_RIEAD|nr:HXXEE domain-containing protein [Riemerella anatipestifer]AGC41033.1 hypothetical protein G148_1729 [Riemerella anatipestifer RA-CH-2]ADQ82979.1 putative integral inner membrane protein [Riemerella anatipestifer ATCC 11845 = DSM 15868]ADZ11532.1 hypothetical protein RIA_0353 [Riemerella anatipestifer RA-GD]AFD55050.1 integral inner membrane protein [Riemerella anatipestifer ATCC 11845 = DSM 15868]AKP70143.1 integral inner membrane protein [Riemerella anatipestifer]
MTNNLDNLISILPFAFLIHNIEEIFGMERWTKSISKFYPQPVTTRQFSIAAGLFTFLGFVLILTKKYYQTEQQYLLTITGFAGMLLLNVFFPHTIATIYLKKYSPGLITGLLLNFPLTTFILWTIYNSNNLPVRQMAIAIILGSILGVLLAFIFLKIGKFVDDKLKKE